MIKKEFIQDIVNFISIGDIENEIFSIENREILKKTRKFKEGKSYDLKEEFADFKFNGPGDFRDIMNPIREIEKNIRDNTKDIFILIQDEFMSKSNDSLYQLLELFPWCSDTVSDIKNIKELLIDKSIYSLQNKLLFKETYALIDKLFVECSLWMSEKYYKAWPSDNNSKKETENFRKKYLWNFYQSKMMNDTISFLGKGVPCITKMEIDSDGWIREMAFETIEGDLNKWNNIQFHNISQTRNLIEHSLPGNLFDRYIMGDNHSILSDEQIDAQMSVFWYDQITMSIIIVIFLINELNEKYIKKII